MSFSRWGTAFANKQNMFWLLITSTSGSDVPEFEFPSPSLVTKVKLGHWKRCKTNWDQPNFPRKNDFQTFWFIKVRLCAITTDFALKFVSRDTIRLSSNPLLIAPFSCLLLVISTLDTLIKAFCLWWIRYLSCFVTNIAHFLSDAFGRDIVTFEFGGYPLLQFIAAKRFGKIIWKFVSTEKKLQIW